MPADVRATLHRQLRPYRRAHPDVRWTQPETWHLTLLFLGSVAPDRVAELELLVQRVAEATSRYHARADRGGGRSRRGDGVGWLGLSEGADDLIEAASITAAGCPPDITDGPPPRPTRSAHVTVARRVDEAVVRSLREQAHGPLGAGWEVGHIALVRSHLERGGARYETLHEATL